MTNENQQDHGEAPKENHAGAKVVSKVVVPPRTREAQLDTGREVVEHAGNESGQATAGRAKWKLRGKKVVITLELLPDHLVRLDAMADKLGMSRSELIRSLIRAKLEEVPRQR